MIFDHVRRQRPRSLTRDSMPDSAPPMSTDRCPGAQVCIRMCYICHRRQLIVVQVRELTYHNRPVMANCWENNSKEGRGSVITPCIVRHVSPGVETS